MMSRFVAVLLWRFANVDVLPMRYSGYAVEVAGLLNEIEKKAASHRDLRFDLAKAAVKKWLEAAGISNGEWMSEWNRTSLCRNRRCAR